MVKSINWGRFPKYTYEYFDFDATDSKSNFFKGIIPYGNGRSYGDCCIGKHIIGLKRYNHFLDFNETTGVLRVQSGVLLEDIISVVTPRGWFLKVNPGTKLITIGGAISSDIHGKNHHIEGCFSESVNWFSLLLPTGEVLKCSRSENEELFLATCGGMGLTGLILDAELTLKKINSTRLTKKTIKTKNLKETFEIFERIKNESYSVAWVDSMSKGKNLGRSIIISGRFLENGDLQYRSRKRIKVPFDFPTFFMNSFVVKLFNWFYYNRVNKISIRYADIDSFFFPLDSIKDWNRIYGKNGFIQYQFILPENDSYKGIKEILQQISKNGKGSFLTVLKLYGGENKNYLSFPMKGYGLSLDFKIEKGIFDLLNKLDEIVLKHNGRIYLAKDARVSKEVFEKGYPQVNKFREIRRKYDLKGKIFSLQSERIGI